MSEFFKLKEYTILDIEQLIQDEVEENIHLDYKASGSLAKDDKKRSEITKDVSSFANSDGGIIVYGVSEKDNKPEDFSYIDGNIITKEWIESVINMIQPRIKGIEICPIRQNHNIEKSIYIVKIPRSDNAPHMAKDHRFYRRFNFMSVAMEEYEVNDLYKRKSTPHIEIDRCAFFKIDQKDSEKISEYELKASITNIGHTMCETYKLNFYINNASLCDILYKPMEARHSVTFLDNCQLKISCPSTEPIYNGETLDLGHITFQVEKKYEDLFLENLIINMKLFYPGGQFNIAYCPKEKYFIEDIDEINNLLEKNTIKNQSDYIDEDDKLE